MRVKAKFKVESVKKFTFGEEIEMSAVYEGSTVNTEEDKRFASASPSGNLKFMVTNPDVLGVFGPGEAFYITFDKA